MTTETETNDETAAAVEVVEDTALAAAANAETDAGEAETEETVEADAKKGDEEVAAVEAAPDTYDTAAFTMPEGVEFDTEGFEAVEPVLRDLNLSQDQAGKLMSAYGEKIVPMITARTLKAQDDAASELRANLARDLQADPEVGGKRLDESRSFAAKAIATAIPDKTERTEFSAFLNETGLGNHRLLMRVITAGGRAMSEASTPAAEMASKPLTESEKFYGKKG